MIPKLSLVVPCYNESATLERCVERVLAIATPDLPIEVVIVDDASRDDSLVRARELAARRPEVRDSLFKILVGPILDIGLVEKVLVRRSKGSLLEQLGKA